MTSDQEHALELDDLPEDLDKLALLADMEALADEAGDWREHLTYEAACNYNSDPATRHVYQDHAAGCEYCQELIVLLSRDGKPITRAPKSRQCRRIFGLLQTTFRRLFGRNR